MVAKRLNEKGLHVLPVTKGNMTGVWHGPTEPDPLSGPGWLVGEQMRVTMGDQSAIFKKGDAVYYTGVRKGQGTLSQFL